MRSTTCSTSFAPRTRCSAQAIDRLRCHPLLAGLPTDTAERLASGLVVHTAAPGKSVQQSCDRGFLLLLGGSVRDVLSDPEGREVLIDLIRAPAVLGLEALLTDVEPRAWNAIEATTWLAIPSERMRSISACHPDLPLRLLETAGLQLERRKRMLYSMAFEPVRMRVARLLAAYVELFGIPDADGVRIPVDLSYERLAQDLGVSTRSIDRAFMQWTRNGWIGKRARCFLGRDLAEILASAEGGSCDDSRID